MLVSNWSPALLRCDAINGRRVVFQYIFFSQLCKLDISVCGDVQRCKEQASKNDVINASRVHDVHDTGGFDLTTPTHSSFQHSSCIDDGHFRSFSDPLYHDHSESKSMPRGIQSLCQGASHFVLQDRAKAMKDHCVNICEKQSFRPPSIQ